MKVRFENVGRFNVSWEADIPAVTYRYLLREVKLHGKLRSSLITFTLDADGTGGLVVVGGWRTVGRFHVVNGIAVTVEW